MLRELLEQVRLETGAPALGAPVGDSRRIRAQAVVGVREAGKPDQARLTDPFHIGSCTKAMTATLAARPVEQGKLCWEHTVGEAFPELQPRIRPEYYTVSLRQLLLHRSGLPDDRKPDPTPTPTGSTLSPQTGDIPKQTKFATMYCRESNNCSRSEGRRNPQ